VTGLLLARERPHRRRRQNVMAHTCPVRPARKRSQPSTQSAPSAIADTKVMTFAPGFAAAGRSPRSTV
jgi:hypothetical protein